MILALTFLSRGRLVLLLAVAALIAAYVVMQLRRKEYAVRFTNLALLREVVGRGPGVWRHVPPLLFLLGMAALLVSLARPSIVLRHELRIHLDAAMLDAEIMVAVDGGHAAQFDD